MPVTLQRVDQAAWEADAQVRTDLLRIYKDAPAERLPHAPEEFVRRHLAEPTHFFCCAHFNDRLIGAVAITAQPEAWWLAHLCIRHSTRRRGVGTRLLTLTHEAAGQQGCQLRVVSSQLALPDQLLLRRLGYRLTPTGDYFALDLPPKGAGP
ncbi:PanM family protein [Halomonas sp. 18H]|nr:PanM family protein [Halomonas sp. 18H]MCW4152978.1 PanM family protein [Halomonas sp. 18H]